MSTLTLTIILTLKQHSLNIRQTPTPGPGPGPEPDPDLVPRFTDNRLLPHKLHKTCTVQVFTRVRVTVEPFYQVKLRTLPQVPCKRKADPISQVFVRSKLFPGPSKGGQPLR